MADGPSVGQRRACTTSQQEAQERRIAYTQLCCLATPDGAGPGTPVAWQPRPDQAARRGLRSLSLFAAVAEHRRSPKHYSLRARALDVGAGRLRLCRKL